jgi:hypothetical protein
MRSTFGPFRFLTPDPLSVMNILYRRKYADLFSGTGSDKTAYRIPHFSLYETHVPCSRACPYGLGVMKH